MADLSPIEIARFWSRVSPASDFHCWEWQGRRNSGRCPYGTYKGEMAHRVAYELINGPIPDGMILRHKCDNPPCCNPRHLIPGTYVDNRRDAIERGQHATGVRTRRTKLSEEQARYILRNPDKMRMKDLAKMFKVSPASISLIMSGKRWVYLMAGEPGRDFV